MTDLTPQEIAAMDLNVSVLAGAALGLCIRGTDEDNVSAAEYIKEVSRRYGVAGLYLACLHWTEATLCVIVPTGPPGPGEVISPIWRHDADTDIPEGELKPVQRLVRTAVGARANNDPDGFVSAVHVALEEGPEEFLEFVSTLIAACATSIRSQGPSTPGDNAR